MTKIKICGCRTPADIHHAAEAGADFVGMVVAENTKRYVPTKDRSSLVEAARDFDIPLVCVLRDNPKPQDQSEAENWYPGDIVQWHGQEDESWPLVDSRPSIRAVSGAEGLLQHAGFPCRHFLLDHEQPGSGHAFDWDSLKGSRLPEEWFLAGGLNAGNVENAIRTLNPWAVDVSSGVESSPGMKCQEKIRAFVAAVKRADQKA